MNVRRLQKLSDFLRGIPKKYFKMLEWTSCKTDEDVSTHIHKPDQNECGFAACAMGWACQIPSFRKAGLKLELKQDIFGTVGPTPTFEGDDGFHAASKFFNISNNTAEHLFYGAYYTKQIDQKWNKTITPQRVAKRIDKLIEEGEDKFNQNFYKTPTV